MFPSPSFDEDTYDHDVFLNFCGQDTRNGFTSHLYKSLKDEAVKAFKDDNGKGERITPSHSNAIRKSRIAIVVFSQNYASSTPCLEELALIYERYTEEKMTVFPVFYDVDPAVVRYQKASYATAFEKYEKERSKHDIYKLRNWRATLCQVACLHGWHFKQRGEVNEPNLISEITAKVCGDLKTWSLKGKGKKNTVPRNSNGKAKESSVLGSLKGKGKESVPEHSKALNLTPYMSPQIKEVTFCFCPLCTYYQTTSQTTSYPPLCAPTQIISQITVNREIERAMAQAAERSAIGIDPSCVGVSYYNWVQINGSTTPPPCFPYFPPI